MGHQTARTSRWIESHNLEPRTFWWGLVWAAGNIGLIAVLMLLASAD